MSDYTLHSCGRTLRKSKCRLSAAWASLRAFASKVPAVVRRASLVPYKEMKSNCVFGWAAAAKDPWRVCVTVGEIKTPVGCPSLPAQQEWQGADEAGSFRRLFTQTSTGSWSLNEFVNGICRILAGVFLLFLLPQDLLCSQNLLLPGH